MVFELQDGSISAGDKRLLTDAELWLERGEHVSIVGANGTGKTTLIETLAGRRTLSTASCGPATTSRSAICPSTPRNWPREAPGPCWKLRSARPG